MYSVKKSLQVLLAAILISFYVFGEAGAQYTTACNRPIEYKLITLPLYATGAGISAVGINGCGSDADYSSVWATLTVDIGTRVNVSTCSDLSLTVARTTMWSSQAQCDYLACVDYQINNFQGNPCKSVEFVAQPSTLYYIGLTGASSAGYALTVVEVETGAPYSEYFDPPVSVPDTSGLIIGIAVAFVCLLFLGGVVFLAVFIRHRMRNG